MITLAEVLAPGRKDQLCQPIELNDGTVMSIQAGSNAYSEPRGPRPKGRFTEAEVLIDRAVPSGPCNLGRLPCPKKPEFMPMFLYQK